MSKCVPFNVFTVSFIAALRSIKKMQRRFFYQIWVETLGTKEEREIGKDREVRESGEYGNSLSMRLAYHQQFELPTCGDLDVNWATVLGGPALSIKMGLEKGPEMRLTAIIHSFSETSLSREILYAPIF